MRGGILALVLGATAPVGAALAQSSSQTSTESSQSSTGLPSASCPLTPSQLNAVRAGVGSAFVGGNAYLYHYFKKAWWSGERAPHFFFHADWDQEFRDQDKFGHLLGGYHLARIGYAGLREACVRREEGDHLERGLCGAVSAPDRDLRRAVQEVRVLVCGHDRQHGGPGAGGDAGAASGVEGDQADVLLPQDARAQETT